MKTIQLTIICTLLMLNGFGIQSTKSQNSKNTIENQFQHLYKTSNNYREFKVVKRNSFLRLQKNVLDSISAIKAEAISKQETIKTQQETITSLENTISKTNKELSASVNKVDNISLFGLQLSKVTYNTILWGLIAVLLASLLFFIFKYKSSNSLTNEAKQSLADVEQDLEQHRKKAIENEQKLRRQLQDEINKQRGV